MPFDENGNFVRVQVAHPVEGESKTKQSMRDEADINEIVRRANAFGAEPVVNPKNPIYGDFSNANDYYDCYNRVLDAQEAFLLIDPRARKYCDNDPGKWVEKIFDPREWPKLQELGVLEIQLPEAAAAAIKAKAEADAEAGPDAT